MRSISLAAGAGGVIIDPHCRAGERASPPSLLSSNRTASIPLPPSFPLANPVVCLFAAAAGKHVSIDTDERGNGERERARVASSKDGPAGALFNPVNV